MKNHVKNIKFKYRDRGFSLIFFVMIMSSISLSTLLMIAVMRIELYEYLNVRIQKVQARSALRSCLNKAVARSHNMMGDLLLPYTMPGPHRIRGLTCTITHYQRQGSHVTVQGNIEQNIQGVTQRSLLFSDRRVYKLD